MNTPSWQKLQEMFDTQEVTDMVEALLDSPSEDNLLFLIRHAIEKFVETQK